MIEFPVVERPDEEGIGCLVTGTARIGQEPFVRLGFYQHLPFSLGCVYLSQHVAESVATAIGWEPAAVAQELREELARVTAENDQLKTAQATEPEILKEADELSDAFVKLISLVERRVQRQNAEGV